uniref:SPARC_Ca_bdg domain-containing protein n=1 Tax=Steinernema glaseri TaxID=37863 RepID=A0A1I8AMV0_9BILA
MTEFDDHTTVFVLDLDQSLRTAQHTERTSMTMSLIPISFLALVGFAFSFGSVHRHSPTVSHVLSAEEREQLRNLIKTSIPQPAQPEEKLDKEKISKEYLQKLVRMRPESCKVNGKTIHSMVFCPTPRVNKDSFSWNCIRYSDLCDGHLDCPNEEDEDPTFCMFQKLVEQHRSERAAPVSGRHRPSGSERSRHLRLSSALRSLASPLRLLRRRVHFWRDGDFPALSKLA